MPEQHDQHDQHERAVTAVNVPMSTGAGMSPSVGVAAPIGAVSGKDRGRAARTALTCDGATTVLHTELAGTASLQRLEADGSWVTLDKRPTPKTGDTRFELPTAGASYRVVFAPKNSDITSWISEPVEA